MLPSSAIINDHNGGADSDSIKKVPTLARS